MKPETLQQLIDCDRRGFLLAPGESESAFWERLRKTEAVFRDFDAEMASAGNAPCEVFPGVSVSGRDRMAPDAAGAAEAQVLTERLYGFSIRHVPVFFLSRNVGLLWGGCAITADDSPLSLILLRNAFRTGERFLFYRRTELIAHENCHAARAPIGDWELEEFFAYQCSPSRLRRTFGNCFIYAHDAVLFLLPLLLLPCMAAVQCFLYPALPMGIFWLLAAVYPVYLLLRNARSLRKIRRGVEHLREAGVRAPLAVLFRCTSAECAELAETPPEKVDAFFAEREKEPRFQVISARFRS